MLLSSTLQRFREYGLSGFIAVLQVGELLLVVGLGYVGSRQG